MKYILRTLDENIKQSTNIEDLNNACIYYKTMKSYLEAMPDAQVKNQEFFDLLVKQCYQAEESPTDEPLTPERIQADTQFVSRNISEYYGLMLNILRGRENNPTR